NTARPSMPSMGRPLAATASLAVAPSGSSTTTARCARGSASTTSTRISVGLVGHAHEVVDHAVGQSLQAEPEGRDEQAAARLEVQHQRDLACRLVERVEFPPPFE